MYPPHVIAPPIPDDLPTPDDEDTGNRLIVALQDSNPVALGDTATSTVFNSLKDHCSQTSCESDPWELDTFYVDHTNQRNQAKITVTAVDTTFRNDTIGGLVEILKKFVDEGAAEKKEVTYVWGSNCVYPKEEQTCDMGEELQMDTWTTSSDWDIRIENGDHSVKDHIRLSIKLETGEDAFLKAFCKALTAGGSALFGTLGAGTAAIGSRFALVAAGCELS